MCFRIAAVPADGWPGERWLDIRRWEMVRHIVLTELTDVRLRALLSTLFQLKPIMSDRIRLARAKQCTALVRMNIPEVHCG